MPANRKRTPFHPYGPFVARKNFLCSGRNFTIGKKASAAALGVDERRLEQLFDANFIDMATDPLDRDGDGRRGGSLTDHEEQALAGIGLTVDQWLGLSEKERAEALDRALSAPETGATAATGGSGAGDAPTGATAPSGPENGPGDTTAAADTGTPATAEAGEAPEGVTATSPADTKIAAYKNFGFGKFYAINAAGEKLGEAVGKSVAEGLAAAAAVPLLGQKETLGG